MQKKEPSKNAQRLSLALTGYVQVFFVAVNTYFLAQANYGGVVVASFMISMVWSFNVKRVAFGTMSDRVIYALGATGGSITGLWASTSLMDVIQNITN